MKNNHRNKFLTILITFSISLFFISYGWCETNQIAEEKFMEGYNAFKSGDLINAKDLFQKSYEYMKHSKTAYYLSRMNYELDKPHDADEFCSIALSLPPTLSASYIDDLQKIKNWAKLASKNPYYKVSGKADSFYSPTPKPDKLSEPSENKKSVIFKNPVIGKYRLDWCRIDAQECGKGAADAYCLSKGYSRSQSFEQDTDIGEHSPTRVIGTGTICNQIFCDGFKFIACEE